MAWEITLEAPSFRRESIHRALGRGKSFGLFLSLSLPFSDVPLFVCVLDEAQRDPPTASRCFILEFGLILRRFGAKLVQTPGFRVNVLNMFIVSGLHIAKSGIT